MVDKAMTRADRQAGMRVWLTGSGYHAPRQPDPGTFPGIGGIAPAAAGGSGPGFPKFRECRNRQSLYSMWLLIPGSSRCRPASSSAASRRAAARAWSSRGLEPTPGRGRWSRRYASSRTPGNTSHDAPTRRRSPPGPGGSREECLRSIISLKIRLASRSRTGARSKPSASPADAGTPDASGTGHPSIAGPEGRTRFDAGGRGQGAANRALFLHAARIRE